MSKLVWAAVCWIAAALSWLADRLYGDLLFEAIKPHLPGFVMNPPVWDIITFGPPIILVIVGAFLFWLGRQQARIGKSDELYHGVALIFQEEDHLTFKEIAERWAKSSSGNPAEILQWLVSDMWLGKFEDEKGFSRLQVYTSRRTIESEEERVYLSGEMTMQNRHLLFHMCARDTTICREMFGNDRVNRDDGQLIAELTNDEWERLSKIPISLFDTKDHIMGTHFRRNHLEEVFISRDDFRNWLTQTKRPLPKAWSE